MKKVSITISYDEEKLSALKLYLEQKNMKVEDEMTKSLEQLYKKSVPNGVRDFIEMRSGTGTPDAKASRKVKHSTAPDTVEPKEKEHN